MISRPEDHPDLRDLGRTLQQRLDRILEAEQAAAATLARRSTTFRDRLLDSEDQPGRIAITTRTGARFEGALVTVGVDLVEIHDGVRSTILAFDQIVAVELP
jgi:hypothetical protein